ncbi:hypothetical protein ASG85_33170 [Paenibacillus sp. Soil724D2]|nr:hypothetical protein ASG85_33170 [Paenibacillus sp. Soil724D2]
MVGNKRIMQSLAYTVSSPSLFILKKCRVTRILPHKELLKSQLFLFYDIKFLSRANDKNLMSFPTEQLQADFVKLPRNDSVSSLRLMNSQDFTL